MSSESPTLHLLCGKIASGKSTLTARLGCAEATVIVAEDAWLSVLYPSELTSLADYVRCTTRLREAMGPHIAALLNSGISVVLDFPANTVETRNWMRGILERTSAAHVLHVLDVPDSVCIARLHARNASGDHPFAATEEQFWQVSRHFMAPSPEEDFNIIRHVDDVGTDDSNW